MSTFFDTLNVSRRDVPGSYIIEKQGGLYYAKSLVAGQDDLSDPDKTILVLKAFNTLVSGMIWIKQVVGALGTIAFNNPKVLVFQELDGTLYILNGNISGITGVIGPPGPAGPPGTPGTPGSTTLPYSYDLNTWIFDTSGVLS